MFVKVANVVNVVIGKSLIFMTNEAKPEKVEKLFTETAESYSALFQNKPTGKSFVFRTRRELTSGLCRSVAGRLLDCAVGSGEIVSDILRGGRISEATLVDLSPRMLDIAKGNISGVTAESGDIKVDYLCKDIFSFLARGDSDQYELILCLGLIAHSGRLEELLTGLAARMSPGGMILLQSTMLGHLGTRIERLFSSERYYRANGYRISYFRHDDILRAAALAKLKVSKCIRYGFGLPFGDKLFPRLNHYIERLMMSRCGENGSEAIYVLVGANER